jgi:hypothetical protein
VNTSESRILCGFYEIWFLASADLQYTYIFSITDAKVTMKITDAVLIHSTQDGYRLDRVRAYFEVDDNQRKDHALKYRWVAGSFKRF